MNINTNQNHMNVDTNLPIHQDDAVSTSSLPILTNSIEQDQGSVSFFERTFTSLSQSATVLVKIITLSFCSTIGIHLSDDFLLSTAQANLEDLIRVLCNPAYEAHQEDLISLLYNLTSVNRAAFISLLCNPTYEAHRETLISVLCNPAYQANRETLISVLCNPAYQTNRPVLLRLLCHPPYPVTEVTLINLLCNPAYEVNREIVIWDAPSYRVNRVSSVEVEPDSSPPYDEQRVHFDRRGNLI